MDGTTTRETWRRWSARLLALLGLGAVVVALFVVIGGSLDSSDGDDKKVDRERDRGRREQPEPRGETYVVQPGDNLSAIAESANLPEERLLELNPDIDPRTLQPGQTLKLRPG